MYRMEMHVSDGVGTGHMAAISGIDGSYIGTEERAKFLCDERGIAPQAIPGNKVASIGFCEKEQKWYGWSHRAICGFGVGSKVSKGDCAYVPINWDDLIDDAIRFWDDEHHEETMAVRAKDRDGRDCVHVEWRYSQSVPNEKIRGTLGGADMYPPSAWGKGEWQAETLEDAKRMAIDFAESVA